jgi:hypothetical protein
VVHTQIRDATVRGGLILFARLDFTTQVSKQKCLRRQNKHALLFNLAHSSVCLSVNAHITLPNAVISPKFLVPP